MVPGAFQEHPQMRGRPIILQNNVIDVHAAHMVEQHEELLVAAKTGELDVNPLFFAPPPASPLPARLRIGQQQYLGVENSGDISLAFLNSPGRIGAAPSINPISFAASDFATLFKTPIDWDREAQELDAQTDGDELVPPYPATRSEAPSDTSSLRSASSTAASITRICLLEKKTSSAIIQDKDLTAPPAQASIKATKDSGIAVAETGSNAPDRKDITARKIKSKPATFTSPEIDVAAIQVLPTQSHLPTRSSKKPSLSTGWPAKKAMPTTMTFTRHLICHWSSIKYVVEAQQPWSTRNRGGRIVLAWEKPSHER